PADRPYLVSLPAGRPLLHVLPLVSPSPADVLADECLEGVSGDVVVAGESVVGALRALALVRFVGGVVEVGGEAESVFGSDFVLAAVGGGPGVFAADIDGDGVVAVVGAQVLVRIAGGAPVPVVGGGVAGVFARVGQGAPFGRASAAGGGAELVAGAGEGGFGGGGSALGVAVVQQHPVLVG